MEKRVIGIILVLLGVAGLIIAGVYFMGNNHETRNLKGIFLYGILGIVFFSAGVGLIRNTKDKET